MAEDPVASQSSHLQVGMGVRKNPASGLTLDDPAVTNWEPLTGPGTEEILHAELLGMVGYCCSKQSSAHDC